MASAPAHIQSVFCASRQPHSTVHCHEVTLLETHRHTPCTGVLETACTLAVHNQRVPKTQPQIALISCSDCLHPMSARHGDGGPECGHGFDRSSARATPPILGDLMASRSAFLRRIRNGMGGKSRQFAHQKKKKKQQSFRWPPSMGCGAERPRDGKDGAPPMEPEIWKQPGYQRPHDLAMGCVSASSLDQCIGTQFCMEALGAHEPHLNKLHQLAAAPVPVVLAWPPWLISARQAAIPLWA